MKFRNRSPKAFTLIELLIVVAIIAILAAIAIPNFLEAQTRSKVSRVKSDLRTTATAVESYIVDYNSAPWDGARGFGGGGGHWGWASSLQLTTTPIAYMTTVLPDVFQDPRMRTVGFANKIDGTPTTCYVDASRTKHCFDYSTLYWESYGTMEPHEAWLERFGYSMYKLGSAGPDEEIVSIWGFELPYDPSNGTISLGNIHRWQGATDE